MGNNVQNKGLTNLMYSYFSKSFTSEIFKYNVIVWNTATYINLSLQGKFVKTNTQYTLELDYNTNFSFEIHLQLRESSVFISQEMILM